MPHDNHTGEEPDWSEMPVIHQPEKLDHFQHVTHLGATPDDDIVAKEGDDLVTSSIEIVPNPGDEGDEPTTASRFYHWRFIGGMVLYTLAFVVTLAIEVVIAVQVIKISYPPIIYVCVGVVILATLTICTYAYFLRKVDRAWVNENARRDTYAPNGGYNRLPHISMFTNSIFVQALIWIVLFAVVSVALRTGDAGWQLHLAIQAVVTVVNSYLVLRTYVRWQGSYYTISNGTITINCPDIFWLSLVSTGPASYALGTRVGNKFTMKTPMERFAFKTRRTIIIGVQNQETPYVKLRYIDDVNALIAAIQ